MREDILSRLSRINEEEKRILDGENKVNKRLYTAFAREFIVNSHRLMQDGEQIALRRHTRFADFPAHGHNYVEMTYVCSGEVTHVIKHREVKMRAGDALLLNRHAQHSVRKTGEGDISINVMLATECFHSLASALPISSPLSSFMAENIRSNGEGEYMLFSTEGVPPLENLFETSSSPPTTIIRSPASWALNLSINILAIAMEFVINVTFCTPDIQCAMA